MDDTDFLKKQMNSKSSKLMCVIKKKTDSAAPCGCSWRSQVLTEATAVLPNVTLGLRTSYRQLCFPLCVKD